MEAFETPGINPEVAILTHGGVWVSAGLKNWPDSVQELNKPVPCTGAGEATSACDHRWPRPRVHPLGTEGG